MDIPLTEMEEGESQQGNMHSMFLSNNPAGRLAHHKCCLFDENFAGKLRGIPVNVTGKMLVL